KYVYTISRRGARWYHIGNARSLSLADARVLAAKVAYLVAEGEDPHTDRLVRRSFSMPVRKRRRIQAEFYVIHAKSSSLFKLGISNDPNARLRDLQVGSPVPLKLIAATVVKSMEDERYAHQILAQWHSHGEWFDLGLATGSFMQRIQKASRDIHSLLAVLS